MSSRFFFEERPPKGGVAKKLWDWIVKITGSPPKVIYVNTPGCNQRSVGAPRWVIEIDGNEYYVYDWERTIKRKELPNVEDNYPYSWNPYSWHINLD